MRYEDVAHLLPGLVDGSEIVDERTRAFIATDLRCQAELARYSRILRGLRELREQYLEPHPGLLAQTLLALEEASERSLLRVIAERKRLAGVVGTAVVTAGAATAAAVIIARNRRVRTPAVAA
jgi:anti-sigma factor RsiW